MFIPLEQPGRPLTMGRYRDGQLFITVSGGGASQGVSAVTRLHHLFEQSCDRNRQRIALVCASKKYSYGELDQRANRLARHLLATGIRPGDRVGIVLARSLNTYVSLLAILKAGGAFVPMDPGFPEQRLAFISKDAGLAAILTTSDLRSRLTTVTCPLILLDREEGATTAYSNNRIAPQELGPPNHDNLCYIIYTSGSTGNPKGVAIEHPSICNFVRVASTVYDIRPQDRIYQGMTIAFDFSIEEIWLGLSRGATLVAGPTDERRLGSGLAAFLDQHRVTVFCCVPTLLATLDKDIASLRTLIVGGEPCPRALVERWARPGRRLLNTYGPTEATVTASWGELVPGRPVTIGRPMPTYAIYILDDAGQPVADGETGEICIAGIGLARGYVNLPEKTRQAFIPDTLNTPDNPSGRIYRTGDLGRIRPDGEIEYLGRMDTQVKIRGYRIELTEIESVILTSPAVTKAVVAPYTPADGEQELVAYCELRPGCRQLDEEDLVRRLRASLPAYMVPAFLEIVKAVPLLANGKADRSKLPPPSGKRLAMNTGDMVAPATPLEERIGRELAALLGVEQVSVTADFFLDLGAHSLIVARLVSSLRKDPAMAGLGLADLYRYPTIRQLAEKIEADSPGQTDESEREPGPRPAGNHISSRRVWGCGLAQMIALFLVIAILALPGLVALDRLLTHIDWTRPDWLRVIGVSAAGMAATLLVTLVLPPATKWLLLGRLQPGRHPLWGGFFLRFWLVDKMMAMAPLALLAGTPLLGNYYRLFGARIGKGVILASPLVHLPDLITIGAGSSVNTGSHIFTYRVEQGYLVLEPVTIGADCVIGSNSVVMPGTVMADGSGLGDQSLLDSGQKIGQGAYYAGSPARSANRPGHHRISDAESIADMPLPVRLSWAAAIPATMLVPLFASLPVLLLAFLSYRSFALAGLLFVAPLAGLVGVLSLNGLIVACKKLVLPEVEPAEFSVHSVYYVRKWFVDRLLEMSLTMTNSLYATLYLAPFLRAMGARIGRMAEISTISHITPDLLTIGDESFVADIVHVGPQVVAFGRCRLDRVRVGRRSFIGNAALVAGGTDIGDNSLIGVLSVAPGEKVAPDTTWLGSPAINLPRREQSESFPEELTFAPPPRLILRRLCYEYFRVTLPATLTYLGALLLLLAAITLLAQFSLVTTVLMLAPISLLVGLALTLLVAMVKKLLIGAYRPRVRPMWSSFVWRSELVTALYENVVVPWLLARLTGTPFMAPVMRLFGARIGKRCYLETTFLTEFDLVRVGDDCTIGRGCSLQTHLFEDRVMKMSRLRVGSGCSIGPRAVILYDAVLEDNVRLASLSLVMKGETLARNTRWQGSPAQKKILNESTGGN